MFCRTNSKIFQTTNTRYLSTELQTKYSTNEHTIEEFPQKHNYALLSYFSHFFLKVQKIPDRFFSSMGERGIGTSVPNKLITSQLNSTNKCRCLHLVFLILQGCKPIVKLSLNFPGSIPPVPGPQACWHWTSPRLSLQESAHKCWGSPSAASTGEEVAVHK